MQKHHFSWVKCRISGFRQLLWPVSTFLTKSQMIPALCSVDYPFSSKSKSADNTMTLVYPPPVQEKESHQTDVLCTFFPDALPSVSLRGIYSPEVCFYYPSAFLDSFIIYACLSKNILLDFVYFWMQEMNINGIICIYCIFWHHITFPRFTYTCVTFICSFSLLYRIILYESI